MRHRVRLTRPWSSPAAAPLCLLSALLVAVAPAPLWAGDWYVDDDGDCVNGDGSFGNPFCRIQDAIDATLSGDTIHIAPGTYFENLTILRRDLALIGTDGEQVTIVDGTRSGSVLTVLPDLTVNIDGLTLTNGEAENGGGLVVDVGAAVTLANSTVSGNTATGAVEDVYRYNNYFYYELFARGGGIHSSGTLTLANSTVTDNRIEVSGLAADYRHIYYIYTRGGGIYSTGSLTMTSSTLNGNTIEVQQGDHIYAFSNHGGGLLAAGKTDLKGSTISNNSISVRGFGGGISSIATATIDACKLLDNTVVDGGGGGIENWGPMTLTHSTVNRNSAADGGGIYNGGQIRIGDSVLSSNVATDAGGGVVNIRTMLMNHSTIKENTAGEGGGIFGYGSLANCTVSNNRASVGGGISSFNMKITDCEILDNQATRGGGISNRDSTITRSVIAGNSATTGGGISSKWTDLTLENSTIAGNHADGLGGGLYVYDRNGAGSLYIDDCAIVDNEASSGGGTYLDTGDRSQSSIRHSTIGGNRASASGGGLSIKATQPIPFHFNILGANAAPSGPDCSGTITSEGYNLISDTTDTTVEGNERGNLYDIDPQFADPDGPDDDPATWQDNSWSLQPISPCVDAGDRFFRSGRDIAGNPRMLDGDLNHGMAVDMGAYEFNNVRLNITGDPTPGGTLTIETSGKSRLLLLLFFSTQVGQKLLPPYGTLFMGAPVQFFPIAVIPDTRDVVLPADSPVGMEILVQELAVDLFSGAGNFSNPVKLVIE